MRDFLRLIKQRLAPATPQLAEVIAGSRAAIVRESEKDSAIAYLSKTLRDITDEMAARVRSERDSFSELDEMMAMGGAGPWRLPGALNGQMPAPVGIRESTLPFVAQGAYGDTELMLNNIDWKRETSLSWLEFTRWGIQQIILIARLRCTKDPMLQRGMKVSAQYVFGRGVEITSPDPDTADFLKEWRDRNKSVLGQVALSELEQSKYHDGNLFFVCFVDRVNTGEVTVRTIDATEMMDIITDPDDSSVPWFYRRDWVQQAVDEKGMRHNVKQTAWYPALNYYPDARPETMGDGNPVLWDAPVYHRKCTSIGKWHFGLPIVYAALGYAQTVKRFLEDCMTIRNSLAQFSMLLTTKGGQQALQGAKTQMSTTAGPSASLWDQNPPTVAGGIFASGPGTTLEAFNTKGTGGNMDDVRQLKLMVAMVFGLPESFFADMNTSNLATATSLDRPTQLNFMEKQEIWREDLTTLARFALVTSGMAPSGKLREAARKASKEPSYEVMVNFPAIIEADVPLRIGAIVQSMTLGNKAGEVIGIDEKEGVRQLYQEIGVENAEELLEAQYPDTGPDAYDPVRKKEEPVPEGQLDPATGRPVKQPGATETKESITAFRNAVARLSKAFRVWESQNGPEAG